MWPKITYSAILFCLLGGCVFRGNGRLNTQSRRIKETAHAPVPHSGKADDRITPASTGASPPPGGTASELLSYTGNRLTLYAGETDIHTLLDTFEERTGIVVDYPSGLDNKVTTRFNDLPIEEAMRRIAPGAEVTVEHAYGARGEFPVKVTISQNNERGGSSPARSRDWTWQPYHNEEWGFSCDLPEECELETLVRNPGTPDYVIKEKIAVTAPGGPRIYLDIWTNERGLPLMEWYRDNFAGLITRASTTPGAVNGMINGSLSLIIINNQQQSNNHLVTIIGKGTRVFSFTYLVSDRLNAKDLYDRLLASFRMEETAHD